MFARASKPLRLGATKAIQKRAFGGYHPPAEHPYFGDKSPLTTKWAYTRDTPNSTYGDKFQHPMNYQGHVPVTPEKFSTGPYQDSAFPYEERYANYPMMYIGAAIATSFLTAFLAAGTAHDFVLMRGDTFVPIQGVPNLNLGKVLHHAVYLQGGDKIDIAQDLGSDFKNIYETEYFQQKLQEYVKERE